MRSQLIQNELAKKHGQKIRAGPSKGQLTARSEADRRQIEIALLSCWLDVVTFLILSQRHSRSSSVSAQESSSNAASGSASPKLAGHKQGSPADADAEADAEAKAEACSRNTEFGWLSLSLLLPLSLYTVNAARQGRPRGRKQDGQTAKWVPQTHGRNAKVTHRRI